MTASMRWEHNFQVCAGDLIPRDYYSQMEQYSYQVPNYYFINTSFFMKIYCFFYIGVFIVTISFGFLITLWVSYRTTFKDDRLPHDPPFGDELLNMTQVPLSQIAPNQDSNLIDALKHDQQEDSAPLVFDSSRNNNNIDS